MSKTNAKYAKLVMVTPDNNNKYYEMTWDGSSSNFTVKYGRVESTAVNGSYPISKWDSKHREKVNKGYKDVTDLVTVAVSAVKAEKDNIVDVAEKAVNSFLTTMKKYMDGLVQKTYSVKAEAVSQKQVDEAQKLIDEINKMDAKLVAAVNKKLVELYMVIPRYMGQVQSYLLPNIKLGSHMEQEQDNLDAMAAQVSLIKPVDKKKAKAEAKKAQTMLDKLGITMTEATGVPKDVEYLIKQKHGQKVKAIFEVNKPAEDAEFDKWLAKQKDKSTSILIHGTRCTSVVPILEIGLKIRPAGNFQFSGKAYGDGNYFSEHMQKSLGYTGWDNDKVILVYEVHTGNPYVYSGWYNGNSFNLNYSELSKRGFDSTYVKAGGGLQNSEIIAYKECQNRIKYIIWLT
jgi:poly [ADP-ribose] polymerase 2/3/4